MEFSEEYDYYAPYAGYTNALNLLLFIDQDDYHVANSPSMGFRVNY